MRMFLLQEKFAEKQALKWAKIAREFMVLQFE